MTQENEPETNWEQLAHDENATMRLVQDEKNALQDELARVRGLLQRVHELMGCTTWSDLSFRVQDKWITLEDEVFKELKGGAESADIGKVNSVEGEKA